MTSHQRPVIGASSLVVGPALMSVGDLLHPAENWDPALQVAALATSAWHWYVAHLLLFIGMLLFVPGILEVTRLASTRRPAAGYAARLLMLVSVGALSSVFVFEMLLGQVLAAGATPSDATALLETFQATPIFGALLPGLLSFFIGTALAVVSLSRRGDPYRWPAMLLGLGALLILGEIVLAQVLLSQLGNVLILVAGIGFARLVLREAGGPAM